MQGNEETQSIVIAERDHAVLEPTALRANDGSILRAWYMRVAHGNGDTVILLHGQSDNRVGMLGTADLLLRHGYSVLIPDARGQGTSGGAIVTYGVKEADDIRRWANWLDRTQAPRCVDALGESMGRSTPPVIEIGAWILRGRSGISVCELSGSVLRPHRGMGGCRSMARTNGVATCRMDGISICALAIRHQSGEERPGRSGCREPCASAANSRAEGR